MRIAGSHQTWRPQRGRSPWQIPQKNHPSQDHNDSYENHFGGSSILRNPPFHDVDGWGSKSMNPQKKPSMDPDMGWHRGFVGSCEAAKKRTWPHFTHEQLDSSTQETLNHIEATKVQINPTKWRRKQEKFDLTNKNGDEIEHNWHSSTEIRGYDWFFTSHLVADRDEPPWLMG